MGQPLGINESSKIILEAIKATGENFDSDFYHVRSAPGTYGILVEIADRTLEKEISAVSGLYNANDYMFILNIPYEYFDDDQLPEDAALGLDTVTHLEVKAELRCMDLIAKTYKNWIKDHKLFTGNDLIKIINEAVDKLKKVKNLDLYFHDIKKEITEKSVSVFLTENHIQKINFDEDAKFFKVDLYVSSYYTPVGLDKFDKLIGESNLKKRSKKEICLLRVAYTIYSTCLDWLKQNWPDVYDDYVKGKF